MTYDDIIAYFRNPLIPAIEILFVITVVTHSLIGMRGIVLDMNPRAAWLRPLTEAFGLLGLFAIGYGIWLALVIAFKSA